MEQPYNIVEVQLADIAEADETLTVKNVEHIVSQITEQCIGMFAVGSTMPVIAFDRVDDPDDDARFYYDG